MLEFLNDTRMIWDIRVAIDQLLGALGAGIFIAALLVRNHEKTARRAAALGPVAVVVGLLVLMTELGNPVALYNVLMGNPESVLFWGILLQGVFVIISVLYVLPLYGDTLKFPFVASLKSLVRPLGIAGGLLAGLVAFYHGLLLSDVIARPVWNNPILPVISLVAGLTSGIAVAMVLSLKAAEESEGVTATLMPSLKWLLSAQLVLLLSLGLQLSLSSTELLSASGGTVVSSSVQFWIGAVAVGTVAPLAAVFAFSSDLRRKMVMVTILVLVGALAYRYIMLQAGSSSVVFNLPIKLVP